VRTRSKLLGVLAALAVAIPTAAVTTNASAASPATLPLVVTNNTGRSEPVYLYMIGTFNGRWGYVNQGGTFSPWPAGGLPPVPAPDVSVAGPGNGGNVTLRIPKGLSGRLYMAIGNKISFFITPDGFVQPAPWASGDPNYNVLFDTSEFTYNDSGLWLNSSQVDLFAIPHAVTVTNGAGVTKRTGDVVPDGRNKVINAIRAQAGWDRSIITRSDGTVLRVLAPGKAADAGLFSTTYLDSYINSAWAAYTGRTLTVVPRELEPNRKFMGRTSGNVMNFTDSSGAQVATVQKPTSSNVWGCDGVFNAPNVAPFIESEIKRTLCTALVRGTMGTSDVEPVYTASSFYKNSSPNHYSRIIHENMVDGRAYGFAYDDVGHFESLVNDGDPQQAGIIMSPFGADGPQPPTNQPPVTQPPANPPTTNSQLLAGQRLASGQERVSANGRFRLTFQNDGNLVIYDNGAAIWATNTWNLSAALKPTHADMQADGNLVLYNDANQVAWSSNSWGSGRVNPYLDMQNDGNAVIYHNGQSALWSSGTAR
jgi:hypothetical protein